MKISSCFKSKYLRASDLGDRTTKVTIENVQLEAMGDTDEQKPVLFFATKDKGVVLNRTNATVLSERFGDDTDQWSGKTIEISTQRVNFQGRMVDSIRLRVPSSAPSEDFDDDIPF